MPSKVVDIDLQTATGGLPRDTYSDLIVIATEPDVADPLYNQPKAFTTSEQVAAEWGENSDAATAASKIDAKGVEAWWVVMADTDSYDAELIADSDTTSVQTGTVANTPIRGGVDNITVMLDGDEQTVVPTVESPPQTPDSGEVAINFDTGELATGDSSSGAGTGIEVTYETLHWQALETELAAHSLDLAVFADVHADKSYIGDLDELLAFAESESMSVVAAYENGGTYASHEAAMDAYHDIGSYLPSKAFLPLGHMSSSDVAAEQAGRLAVKQPWFDPMWDAGANYSFATSYFREALIGEPGKPQTFEGGDADETGPVNVFKSEAGVTLLSNSLTTAGAGSNYQYFDVFRSETFIAEEVENALTQLRMRNEQIPFAPNGRTLIRDAIQSRLRQYVTSGQVQQIQLDRKSEEEEEEGDQSEQREVQSQTATRRAGAPLSDLQIRVPSHRELAQTNRQNRVWSGIRIEGTLASNAHTFGVTLDVQM